MSNLLCLVSAQARKNVFKMKSGWQYEILNPLDIVFQRFWIKSSSENYPCKPCPNDSSQQLWDDVT